MTRLDDPKFDKGKVQVELIDSHFIIALGEALTYGANKYEPYSWRRLENPSQRYYGALLRHILAWNKGEQFDAESGLSHLSHAAACLMFLSWFDREGGEDNGE